MVRTVIKPLLTALAAAMLVVWPMAVGASANNSIERGAVTNLPIPRFVSLKAKSGNARRGPGLTYRIDWVFKHTNTPLMVTAEFGHWRRVQDKDGLGGWMHYALLSGVRTIIINAPNVALRIKPNPQAALGAYAEEGAIAYLHTCTLDWCFLSAGAYDGWAEKSKLWGVWAEELRP